MDGRQPVGALADIGHPPFLPAEFDVLRDPALMMDVVILRQAHHHDAPTPDSNRVSRLLDRAARELGRGHRDICLHRRPVTLAAGEAGARSDQKRPVRAGQSFT